MTDAVTQGTQEPKAAALSSKLHATLHPRCVNTLSIALCTLYNNTTEYAEYRQCFRRRSGFLFVRSHDVCPRDVRNRCHNERTVTVATTSLAVTTMTVAVSKVTRQ